MRQMEISIGSETHAYILDNKQLNKNNNLFTLNIYTFFKQILCFNLAQK